ncbi:MAG: NAD(P)/FAD-dependent oxidoreductase [Archaeoglobales archaeon]|nr:MAG: NAD(P)/FAD-dependent oxidoreductase [Archaeoglobales archaeon]
MFDVIVVGAGPGGSIASKTCAEMGLDVLMVEKRQEIGVPVRCAEGISKDALERFVKPKRSFISREVVGAKIFAPDGTEIVLSEERAGNEVGYVLERKIFDRYLAKLASDAGAEVLVKTTAVSFEKKDDRVRVRLLRMGEEWDVETKIVIGADGVESRVAKFFGIDTTLKLNEVESCVQYLMTNIDFDPDYCHFWLGKSIAPGGYVWLFPKRIGANVGIGVMPSLAKKTPKEYLDDFVSKKFSDGKVVEFVAGAVPVCGEIETAVSDNVMLVGDAARHADPITGGGIANAMKAGYYAGIVAFEAVKRGDFSARFLRRYDKLWKDDFGRNLARKRRLQQKLIDMDDDTLNRIFHSIPRNIGELSVRAIVLEIFKRNPKLLWDVKDFIF